MMKKVAPLAFAAMLATAIGTLPLVFGQSNKPVTDDSDRYAVRCFLKHELEKKLNELSKADDWRVVSALPAECEREELGKRITKPGVLVILER